MPSLKDRFIIEIEKIPGVENRPSPVAGGSALFYQGKEFAHFHHDNELDLKLTRKIILQEGLSQPKDSKVHPSRSANSPWIELRFSRISDIKAAARLVKLAIEAMS